MNDIVLGILSSLLLIALVVETAIVRVLTVELPGLTVYSKDDLLRY